VNSTAASLLGLLDAEGGEMTAGELLRVAEVRIGQFWSLTRSQVYRELAVLEREELVQPGPPGPRDARPVRITDAGRAAYREWLTGHLPAETVRIPVLLAVALGGTLDPSALRDVLTQSREEHRARVEVYRDLDRQLAATDDGEPWARATLSFGIRYEEAVLGWFSTLPTEVRPLGDAEPGGPG
jgi:DNA-binding PadR family transcriptional regulator